MIGIMVDSVAEVVYLRSSEIDAARRWAPRRAPSSSRASATAMASC